MILIETNEPVQYPIHDSFELVCAEFDTYCMHAIPNAQNQSARMWIRYEPFVAHSM